MTSFQMWHLFFEALTGIGTCTASGLALYFWLHDKKIKMNYRVMHANAYGSLENIEGGYFVVTLTNRSNWPIILETVGIKSLQSIFACKSEDYYCLFGNTPHDDLPKKLDFGQTYTYIIAMNNAIRMIKELKESEKINISDIKLFVCISTARKEILFKIDKHVKSLLLKEAGRS
jgi:hypothetical protein